MRRLALPVSLAALGAVLVANPLYLDALLRYPTPGDGFGIGALYFAALAGLGLVLSLSAVALVPSLADHTGDAPVIPVLAVAVVVTFVGYALFLDAALDPASTRVLGYRHRRTVIVTTVAVLFALAAGVTARRPVAASALLLYVPAFALVFPESPTTVLFDHLLLVIQRDLLGIPFAGGFVFAATVFYGVWFGRSLGAGDSE